MDQAIMGGQLCFGGKVKPPAGGRLPVSTFNSALWQLFSHVFVCLQHYRWNPQPDNLGK